MQRPATTRHDRSSARSRMVIWDTCFRATARPLIIGWQFPVLRGTERARWFLQISATSSRAYFALIRSLTDLVDAAVIANGGLIGKHAGDGQAPRAQMTPSNQRTESPPAGARDRAARASARTTVRAARQASKHHVAERRTEEMQHSDVLTVGRDHPRTSSQRVKLCNGCVSGEGGARNGPWSIQEHLDLCDDSRP